MSLIMDQEFDRSFYDVAVTEFRSATAREFDLFAACDSVFEFMDEIKNWTFGLCDLLGEPIVKTADSLFASFYFIGGGSAVTVGPSGCRVGFLDRYKCKYCPAARSRYGDLLPQRFRVLRAADSLSLARRAFMQFSFSDRTSVQAARGKYSYARGQCGGS